MGDLKEKVLEEITIDSIVEIMDEFGVPHQPYTGADFVTFQTVCHGGDSFKLFYYQNTKNFYCYTNCGYISIFDMVMKLNSCSFYESLLYLADKLGIEVTYSAPEPKEPPKPLTPEELIPDVNMILAEERGDDGLYKLPVTEYYDDDLAKRAISFYDGETLLGYWEAEGISRDVMKAFEIGSKMGCPGPYRDDDLDVITIPCRDINGHLLGIRGRFFTTDYFGSNYEPKDKYKPVIFNGTCLKFTTSSNLYGIYQNQEIIRKAKKCVIFEGEKSVLKAATMYGEYPCVATYGNHIRPNHIRALCNLGVEEIILAYDYDNTGKDLVIYLRQRKVVSAYTKCSVMYDGYAEYLQVKDSPIDRGKETFEILLGKRL